MQAKPPFNFIPTTTSMVNHLPPLKPTVSCATRPPGDQLGLNISNSAFEDYKSLFTCQRLETCKPVKLVLVDGLMPSEFPMGTYYLIGPGLFRDDHGSTVHPLDGHGYLRAFELNGPNGEVKISAQYVKTEAQMEEFDPMKGSWKFTHRGAFSVLKGGRVVGNIKVMKNVANTTVLKWGGRLLCLWEGGAPYEIHPGSLDTIGRFDIVQMYSHGFERHCVGIGHLLDDVVAAVLKPLLQGMLKMPEKRMLSHYKIDAQRQRLLIMACNVEDMILPRSHITFYEFDKSFNLIQKEEFNTSEQLIVHDWGFTDSHYLVFGNRIKVNMAGLVVASCGLAPMISALCLNPSKPTSPLYLLPRRPDSAASASVELPLQRWLLHVANAFEDKDGHGNRHLQIYATACSYKWFSFQNMFGYEWQTGKFDPSMMNREDEENLLPHLIQVDIDLDAAENCTKCSVEPLSMWTRPSDFPITNPRVQGTRHQYIYAATSSGSHQALPNFPFDTIVKLDTWNRTTQSWSTTKGRFIGEPMFVPKGIPTQEDDGYLLVVEYAVSQGNCYLVIIDAKQIGESSNLVARFAIPKYLTFPLGFHGLWDPV